MSATNVAVKITLINTKHAVKTTTFGSLRVSGVATYIFTVMYDAHTLHTRTLVSKESLVLVTIAIAVAITHTHKQNNKSTCVYMCIYACTHTHTHTVNSI